VGTPLAVVGVTLTNFRSYENLRLRADARPVVLTGPNGAGKTNLLEALSYLAPGRGLRRARLSQIARHAPLLDTQEDTPGSSARQWAVAAELSTPTGPLTVGSGWHAPEEGRAERRAIKIDGETAAGPAALAPHVALVWLTPAMDRIFVDAPSGRRRFLDRLVFGLDPAHAARVQRYDQVRRERARLLQGPAEGQWLAALERTMAEHAVAIAAARLDLVERLEHALTQGAEPFPRPRIVLAGLIEDWLAEMPALAAEDRYREALASSRARDAESGSCAGPHRSDLIAHLELTGAPASEASTGEQKAMLIALVLAHARLLMARRGASPILLLDELVAHLDVGRRGALFEALLDLGAQAWMTGTDRTFFAPLGRNAQFFAVRDATLTEETVIG
jgi:DNA replication and repair protein RecF